MSAPQNREKSFKYTPRIFIIIFYFYFFLPSDSPCEKDVQFLNVLFADFFVHKTNERFCLSFNGSIYISPPCHLAVGLSTTQEDS